MLSKTQGKGRGRGNRRRTMSLDNFLDCLLTETLLWLPLKSVFQCKCISNRWCSLISTPYFTRRYVGHHHHTNLQPFTLLFESADILSNLAFTTDSDEPEIKTLASYVHRYNELEDSCNGLLLWSKWPKDEVPGKMSVYYVMNPITRQCLELPPITQPRGFFIQAGLICSYDCNNNNNIDDKQLSYSVVLIPYLSHKSRKFKIHTFSSNTSESSELEPLLPALEGFELCHFPRSAVSYKGLLFCPGTGGRLLAFGPYNARSCRLIEKPIEYESHGGTDCVGVCQGCLRICQISLWFLLGSVLRVWEFKDYDNEGGGQWFLEHEVFFNQYVGLKKISLAHTICPTEISLCHSTSFHPNDGDILYLVIEMKVVSCNLRSKTMEVFCDIPHGCEGKCTIINFVLPCWPTPIP